MRKMKFTWYLSIAALTVGSMVFMAACHKKDKVTTTTTSEDTGYATDHTLAEKSYSDVENIADEAATVSTSGGTMGYRLTSSPCATVTHSSGTITVDFGTTDCVCLDGRTRRGKIIITYTGGAYIDSGSMHTITFDNYYVNDNNIAGTKTVQNMGLNALGQPYFNVTISGVITKATGGTVTTSWNRVRTWTAGYATPGNYTDDVYAISGSGTLTRATGVVVTIDIPTSAPLVVAYGCRYIEAGTINYTVPAGVRSINFGTTPECNATAILTLPSGATYTITMP